MAGTQRHNNVSSKSTLVLNVAWPMQSLGLARLRTTSVDPGAAAEMSHATRQAPSADKTADRASDAAAGWVVTFGEPLTPVPPLAGANVPSMQPHYS